VFGILFFAYGIWLHHLSNFTFYMTAGLFTSFAVFGAAALVLIFPNWNDLILFLDIGVVAIISLWGEGQERSVRKNRSLEWSAWENVIAQRHALARWLLYPIEWRMRHNTNESGFSQK
jgi:hypothetical protein